MKNRKRIPSQREGGPAGGGWELVYSGFALIMLCFFIMLAAFSNMEKQKVLTFVRSFSDALTLFPGGIGFTADTVVSPGIEAVTGKGETMEEISRELRAFAEQTGLADRVDIYPIREGLGIRLSDTAVFAKGAATISPQALGMLDRIGTILGRIDYAIRIEGHTDDLPIRSGRFPSNWELSTARAVNVLRYFIRRHRIGSGRISAAGFGQHHPVVPNDSPGNRARNRRVEIVLSPVARGAS